MAALTFADIAGRVKKKLGDACLVVAEGNRIPFIKVAPLYAREAAALLRDDPALAFDFLMYITAVDYPAEDKITVVYHFFSYGHRHSLMLKCDVPRKGGRVPSLVPLYAAAEWLEREVYDLFGVTFVGHPNLKRILTPEGFVGHPLLKDFTNEDYVPFPESKL